ncbi:MAG: CHASE2 domain-containing protein [Desulfobulbus sp.]|jgi:signal transduction histidine kinase/CHASE2 domain-containing sensor protein
MPKRLIAPGLALLITCLLHLGGLLTWIGNDGLDLLFKLRGPRPPDQRIVIAGVDARSLQQLGAWPFPRSMHARLLEQLHQAKGIGIDFLFPEPTDDDAVLSRALQQGPPTILPLSPERDARILHPADTVHGQAGSGHIETMLAGDGIVRQVDLRVRPNYPPFSTTLLEAAGVPFHEPATDGPTLINFYGPEETFLFLSYVDVLNGLYPPAFFQGRIVLIGAKAMGLGDAHVTSYTRSLPTPGVEIQATIINNLLDGSFIRPLVSLHWLLIGLISGLAVLVWPNYGERTNLAINAALLAGLLLAAYVLFRYDLLFNYPMVVLFLLTAYPIHLFIQLFRAARGILQETRRLHQTLDSRLRQVARTLPSQYLHSRSLDTPLTSSVVQRHLNRLQSAVHAISLQHHFLEHLLKEKLPALILWEEHSNQPLFANDAFHSLWQATFPEQRSLPDRARFLSVVDSSPAEEESAETLTIELLGVNGRHFYQVMLHPLQEPESDFQGNLAVLHDITEIKEEERGKDEVVSVVSHELKLPLTTILGYAEILTHQLEGKTLDYAQEIYEQCRRLQRMIEDFLDISRLERGRKQVRLFPFPPGRMLEDAVTALTPRAKAAGITIDIEQPLKTSPLIGDEAMLLQAIINLLDNAVKFSPEQSSITVRLNEYAHRFVIEVSDQGPGIPAEERLSIFDKFQRGSRTGNTQGFGLGLHLVRRIIEHHQGTITVLNTPPPGAVFEIELPKHPDIPATEAGSR